MSFSKLYREYLQEENRRPHPLTYTKRELNLESQLNALAALNAKWRRHGGKTTNNMIPLWEKYRRAVNKWRSNWRAELTEVHKANKALREHERAQRARTAPTLKRLAWNAAGLKGITVQQLRALSKLPGVYSQLNLLHPQKPVPRAASVPLSRRKSPSRSPRRAQSSRAASVRR